ncbi:hypothetical protein AB6B38_00870 [Glycocaulis abyssi]|uniref:Uncharacterized protein n=1 Tax=Glycocaulis abyssi TaxID=1433403 RepID=A0ABV9NAE8_9PROT
MRWIALVAVMVLALGAVADLIVSFHLWLFWDDGLVSAGDYLGILLGSADAGFQMLGSMLQHSLVQALLDVSAHAYFPVRALVLAVLALLTLALATALGRRA